MGKVIIHAGMWKTGSSSIQNWLGRYSQRLQREADVALVKATVEPPATVRTELHLRPDPRMFSHDFALQYRQQVRRRRSLAKELLEQIDGYAKEHTWVVISSEALSYPFWDHDEVFLSQLDEFGASHDVRVAYYVRPQHSYLEASWRQSGFRRQQPITRQLERECQILHYEETFSFVRDAAPRIDFAPRPFRLDLLHGRNVVIDFAQEFLGLDARDDMNVWDNPGLSLDIANALQHAPKGLLWSGPEDTDAFTRIKELFSDLDVPDSERARLSRLVLQQACHELFEEENRRLIKALGWETASWVPAVEEDLEEASFERVEALWKSPATQAELALLHHSLARLLDLDRQLPGRSRGAAGVSKGERRFPQRLRRAVAALGRYALRTVPDVPALRPVRRALGRLQRFARRLGGRQR